MYATVTKLWNVRWDSVSLLIFVWIFEKTNVVVNVVFASFFFFSNGKQMCLPSQVCDMWSKFQNRMLRRASDIHDDMSDARHETIIDICNRNDEICGCRLKLLIFICMKNICTRRHMHMYNINIQFFFVVLLILRSFLCGKKRVRTGEEERRLENIYTHLAHLIHALANLDNFVVNIPSHSLSLSLYPIAYCVRCLALYLACVVYIFWDIWTCVAASAFGIYLYVCVCVCVFARCCACMHYVVRARFWCISGDRNIFISQFAFFLCCVLSLSLCVCSSSSFRAKQKECNEIKPKRCVVGMNWLFIKWKSQRVILKIKIFAVDNVPMFQN